MNESGLVIKGIFGNGMVLQQKTISCMSGSYIPGESVKIVFRDECYESRVSENGSWKIEFNPGSAGGPFNLEVIACKEKKVFSDVYVGEVWVNSGQSNAQLPMLRLKHSYPEEYALPINKNIRMITIPISYAFGKEKDSIENPKWICASPETLDEMSGTGYFFAKKLWQDLGVPVGIINASQGGSPVTSWMDCDSLKNLGKKDYVQRAEKWVNQTEIDKVLKEFETSNNKWNEEVYSLDVGSKEGWEQISFECLDETWECCNIPGDFYDIDGAGIQWFKNGFTLSKQQADLLNSKKCKIWMGTIVDADKVWINNEFCGVTYYSYPPRRYEVKNGIFKEGMNTVTVRVQKNGKIPIRFYKEKNYCIFTEGARIHPVAYRNVERVENSIPADGLVIDLTGEWKKKVSCKIWDNPGSFFFEWEPTALFNAMLAPCFDLAVKGALWYQGESNAPMYEEYADLLKQMIILWRQKFKYAQPDMPFIVMQLPNWSDGYDNKDLDKQDFGSWPGLRDAQKEAALESVNCGLSVTIDAGEWNDLHPEKKLTGGTRAAKEALRLAYGKEYNPSPVNESIYKEDKGLVIKFDCGKSKLAGFAIDGNHADFNKKSDEAVGFCLITKNGDEKDVCARIISGNEVLIDTRKIGLDLDDIKEVRYLWKNSPEQINLYSEEKIPVCPFRVKI